MSDAYDPLRDPLDLEAVDREIRINELAERGRSPFDGDDDSPAEVPGALRDVVEYESLRIGTEFDELLGAGVELPAPDSLDDAAITTKLWEVINALAERDVTLSHTDHLSDRELYEHLWNDVLREEGPIAPADGTWMGDIDLLGSWGEEEVQIALRYYDDEETRQRWARQFPGTPIPPHEDPPFDRDRHMPETASQKRDWCSFQNDQHNARPADTNDQGGEDEDVGIGDIPF